MIPAGLSRVPKIYEKPSNTSQKGPVAFDYRTLKGHQIIIV